MAATDDGFALAEYDLEHRGAGDLYGLRQSGLPDWKLASLQDKDLMVQARHVAETLTSAERHRMLEALQNDSPTFIHRE